MGTGVVATIIPDGEVRRLPSDTLQSGTAVTMVFFFISRWSSSSYRLVIFDRISPLLQHFSHHTWVGLPLCRMSDR